MENKKTFGAFILRRRKELGMTQREFAEQLFVTESAVSKWERGMSYPDITLLQNICSVLEITEDELLNGGEDTKRRNSEKLAEKYQRLTQNYRRAQPSSASVPWAPSAGMRKFASPTRDSCRTR